MTVACPADDLRDLTNGERGSLARDIKHSLANSEGCDFKPCGYKLDSGKDFVPIDRNSFEFPLQGSAVRLSGGLAVVLVLFLIHLLFSWRKFTVPPTDHRKTLNPISSLEQEPAVQSDNTLPHTYYHPILASVFR